MPAADYRQYYIPWIVTHDGLWGGIDISNFPKGNTTNPVTITSFDASGNEVSKETVQIPPRGHKTFGTDPKVRSVLIEGSTEIFVTAHQGNSHDKLFTSLKVYDVTEQVTLKN